MPLLECWPIALTAVFSPRAQSFVRLHQPYTVFTAGNQPWALSKDSSHLATAKETVSHLEDIAERCSERVELVSLNALTPPNAPAGQSPDVGRFR